MNDTLPHAPGPVPNDRRLPERYEFVRELGRGGMGVVYLARDSALGREVALKLVLAGASASPEDADRLRREARAAANVRHPGLVQVHEITDHGGLPLLALEYCPGGTLEDRLAANPLTARDAAGLLREIALAVHAAHEAGVVHRDLKPGNVFFAQDGAAKVGDFGLARRTDDGGATRTGSVVGTPSYMAPEQARGEKDAGPAADVYSLGAVLYECLTGRPPFRAATVLETLHQVLTREPPAARSLNPGVPADLETVAHKCLNKDTSRRYASAKDLADDLGRWLAGEPIRARPAGMVERAAKWARRNPALSASLAAVALTVGVAAAVIVYLTAAFVEGVKAESDKARQARDDAKAEAGRANAEWLRAEWLVYEGKIALAQAAFGDGDQPTALKHLAACRPELRGWEHRHLVRRFSPVRQWKSAGKVIAVACGPDGKVRGFEAEGSATEWDGETGALLRVLPEPAEGVIQSRSPDGATLFRSLPNGAGFAAPELIDVPSGRRFSTLLDRDPLSNYDKYWTLDGSMLLTLNPWLSKDAEVPDHPSELPRVTIHDARTGRLLDCIVEPGRRPNKAAWSADGRAALAWTGGRIEIWEARIGRRVLATVPGSSFWGLEWSPDGSRLLVNPGLANLRVWDTRSGKEVASTGKATEKGVHFEATAWSPDGRRFAAAGRDDTVKIFDARTGQPLKTIPAGEQIHGLAWSQDGRRLVTGSLNGTVCVWAADRGRGKVALGHDGACVQSVAWGKGRIITTGNNGVARIFSEPTRRFLREFNVDTYARTSPDAREIYGVRARVPTVFDVETGRAMAEMKHLFDITQVIAWSPDGAVLLTHSKNEPAVYCTRSGRPVLPDTSPPSWTSALSGSFSPCGRRLLTYFGSEFTVCDARTGRTLFRNRTDATILGCAWRPDGSGFIITTRDAVATVYDADARFLSSFPSGHDKGADVVAFSPDASRLLVAGSDNAVRLLDPGTGRLVATLRLPDPVTAAAWSPDGESLLLGDASGRVTVLDTDAADVVDDRAAYHREAAASAEKAGEHFAAAFHLGRLLLESPGDAALLKRRDDAVRREAAAKEAREGRR